MLAPGMSCGMMMSLNIGQYHHHTHLADKALVTDPLFGILGGIKSDLLFTRIDDVGDLEIQHEVKLEHFILLALTWDCQLCLMAVTNFGKNQVLSFIIL